MKASKRWKKFYKGKVYYFPFGASKDDMGGYKLAVAAWHAKKAEVDGLIESAKPGRESYERAIAAHQESLDFYRRFGSAEDQTKAEDHQEKIDELKRRLASPSPAPISLHDWPVSTFVEGFGSNAQQAVLKERRRILGNAKEKAIESKASAVETCVQLFLARQRTKADHGEITAGRCDFLRLGLERFVRRFGGDRSVEEIDGDTLLTYRDHLLGLAAKGEISRVYARDSLGTVNQWIRWLWTSGRIEHAPRALGSKELQIPVPKSKIEVFAVKEIGEMLAVASQRTKLYLLLALNCGMTQKDISDLRHAEVDLKAGTIRRKRSKTHKDESVPEVTYFLWPQTLRLLKAELSTDKVLALTNAKGGPLWVQTIKANGKLAKVDNIKTSYYRLTQRKGLVHLKGKPFKRLRKTASTVLASGPHKHFAQYFLGHAPRTVADSSYIVPSAAEFKAALKWLGDQLGVK